MGKKVCIMTDMEGTAGIANFEDWCVPTGRNYDLGRQFLAWQVNGAVEGFLAGGASEVVVVDGHGPCALHAGLIDPRAWYQRGWFAELWPLCVDKSFDALAFVGQHAKSRTPYAHLAHSQSFSVLEIRINGVAVGEFGQLAMCASELGVRTIFGAGGQAFTEEAQQLAPGIEAVAVKRGLTSGAGDECTAKTYGKRNLSAISLHPQAAAERIRQGAERALKRMAQEPFGLVALRGPFVVEQWLRATEDTSPQYGCTDPAATVAQALNAPMNWGPVPKDKRLG
jgi:D-amino peptidase